MKYFILLATISLCLACGGEGSTTKKQEKTTTTEAAKADDHSGHDHSGHDHSGHDHSGHDHSGHDHNAHKTGAAEGIQVPSAQLATAKDVVCGMGMKNVAITDTAIVNGKVYPFCAKGCKDEFMKNKAKYVIN